MDPQPGLLSLLTSPDMSPSELLVKSVALLCLLEQGGDNSRQEGSSAHVGHREAIGAPAVLPQGGGAVASQNA